MQPSVLEIGDAHYPAVLRHQPGTTVIVMITAFERGRNR